MQKNSNFSFLFNYNLLFFLSFIGVFSTSCKDKTSTTTDPISYNYLFGDQVAANIKLPTHDTTGAFSYISGEINGEKFSVSVFNSSGNDSIEMFDGASKLLYSVYRPSFDQAFPTDTTIFPICFWNWEAIKQDIGSTSWFISLSTGFYDKTGAASFLKYKQSVTTPGSFLNIGCINSTANTTGTCWGDRNVELKLSLITISNSTSVNNNHTASTIDSIAQPSTSYTKVLSVKKYPDGVVYQNKNYHYEITYGFDCYLNGNSQGKTHITNGKAKVWAEDIKL